MTAMVMGAASTDLNTSSRHFKARCCACLHGQNFTTPTTNQQYQVM